MSTRARRYGRPQVHEDPIEDAIEAEQSAVYVAIKAIRETADQIAENGSPVLADQLHHSCTVLQDAGEAMWNRVTAVRKDEGKVS